MGAVYLQPLSWLLQLRLSSYQSIISLAQNKNLQHRKLLMNKEKRKSLSMPKKVKILQRKLTATTSRTIHRSNPPWRKLLRATNRKANNIQQIIQ